MIWELLYFIVRIIMFLYACSFVLLEVIMAAIILDLIDQLKPANLDKNFGTKSNKEIEDIARGTIFRMLVAHTIMVVIYNHVLRDWIWTTTA